MVGADADLEAILVPSSVKVAGAITIGAGVCALVTGLQTLLFFNMRGALNLVGPIALVLGAGCVFSGWGVVRGRMNAAVAAVGVVGLTGLCGMAWVMFTFLSAAISMIAIAVLPLSAVAIFLVTLALKDVKKIEDARGRLRAQGLDGGF